MRKRKICCYMILRWHLTNILYKGTQGPNTSTVHNRKIIGQTKVEQNIIIFISGQQINYLLHKWLMQIIDLQDNRVLIMLLVSWQLKFVFTLKSLSSKSGKQSAIFTLQCGYSYVWLIINDWVETILLYTYSVTLYLFCDWPISSALWILEISACHVV